MRIENLRLSNFRGFEDFEIDFEPRVTLLIGENGTGKTSIIDALAILISQSMFPIWQECYRVLGEDGIDRSMDGRDIKDTDARVLVRHHEGMTDLYPQYPVVLSCRGSVLGSPYTATWEAPRPDAQSGLVFQPFSKLVDGFRTETPTPLPLVVRFPAARGWTDPTHWYTNSPQSRLVGYRYWDCPGEGQVLAVHWIRKYTFVELQEGASVPQLSAIKLAIRAAYRAVEGERDGDEVWEGISNIAGRYDLEGEVESSGVEDIYYDVRSEEVRLKFKHPPGNVIAYPHLSDGFRALIAMVIDLAWRSVVLNPHLGERAPTETSGLVLIDEIEQHLHPSWQRRFLGALHQAFPRLQIIATTHSPQVIASAKPDWIRNLVGIGPPERVRYAEGLDTNSVLREHMGTTERPSKHARLLHDLARFIHEERTEEAWRLHDELAMLWGEDYPELVKARWALEMDGAARP